MQLRKIVRRFAMLSNEFLFVVFIVFAIRDVTSSVWRHDEADASLKLMTRDKRTGRIFVAGINSIYMLDSLLNLIASIRTGPLREACPDVEVECSNDVVTDNHPRILLLTPDNRHLLFCGSIKHGICSVYNSTDLGLVQELNSSNVLNHVGGDKGTVGFFSKDSTFYSATTYDGRPNQLLPKSLSARILDESVTTGFDFEYLHQGPMNSFVSGIDIDPTHRLDYLVEYVDAFEHRGFTYFITIQREALHDFNYHTRLARVCQGDDGCFSYTELELVCRKRNGVTSFYNVAQAARLAKAGFELAQKFGYDRDDDILFIVFGRSEDSSFSAKPDFGSGLCFYSMNDIRKEFTQNQKLCYQGIGRVLPWINHLEPKCKPNLEKAKEITEEFCGSDFNVGMGSRYPLQTDTNFTSDQYLMTALNMVTFMNKTVAVAGTHDGQLVKIVLDGSNSEPYSIMDVSADIGKFPVANSMLTDSSGEYVYTLTGPRISRISLQSCSIYVDCASCVLANDPLGCGWCDDHCSRKSECTSYHRSSLWHEDSCPPIIQSFFPKTGPTHGGTEVTIFGHNFGASLPSVSVSVSVSVAYQNCSIKFRNETCIVCKTGKSQVPRDREIKVYVKDKSKLAAKFDITGTATSVQESFSYRVPEALSIFPTLGPRSGGTRLTISGHNLDIGSSLSIQVHGQDCTLSRRNATEIVCVISPFKEFLDSNVPARSGIINLTIDDATLGNFHFMYVDDPVITDIYPLRSFSSGGLQLTVKGQNLNSIQFPLMCTNVTDASDRQICSKPCEIYPDDGTSMICSSPNISTAVSFNKTYDVAIRFAMDGVSELWDFSSFNRNLSVLVYTVDPELFPTSSELVFEKSILQMKGRNLNLSASAKDYIINVENIPCNVTLLTENEISCYLQSFVSGRVPIDLFVGNINYQEVIFTAHPARQEGSGFMENFKSPAYVVVSIALACAAVFVVAFLVIRYRKTTKSKRRRQTVSNVLYLPGSQIEFDSNSTPDELYRLNPIANSYWSQGEVLDQRMFLAAATTFPREPILDDESRRLLDDSNLIISRERLLLLDAIGQGHFGCVFRGFLECGSKAEVEVAVKTLKSFTVDSIYASTTESRKFLEEALTMRDFNHIHVLKLIGIVIDKEEMPLVVLPFMRHGDLLSYIRNERNNPTVKELMEFGIQIADGMAYLSNLKFVHRDLAARNCMLDDEMLVKVADFGLSRDIYERDYYSSDDRKAKLPVKWMSIESLEKGIYNTKTDVWSFGVVLWELMTRGVSPYPEVDSWDIIKYLKSGRRMLQPSYCPDSLYNLMLHCWNPEAVQRPTFEELATTIQNIIISMEGAHRKVGLDVTYINVETSSSDYLRPLNSVDPSRSSTHEEPSTVTYLSMAPSCSTLV